MLIVLAVYMQRGPVARLESKLQSGDEAGIRPVVERLKSLEYAAMLCGVVVLLLTAMVELA